MAQSRRTGARSHGATAPGASGATAAEHQSELARAGVSPPSLGPLVAYLELLLAWGRRVNLTAARTARERVEVLILPALELLPHLLPGRLLDVGSGNGSPGLLVAVCEPGREVTLLEPRGRRWAFLREAARLCGRPDASVLRLRHQEYAGPPVANLTARALRLDASALDRLLLPGGQALLSAPLPGAEPLGAPRVYRYRRASCST